VSDLIVHRGGCHCGRVSFAIDAPATIEVLDCNCSICRMTGYLHLIVPQSQFRLLSGAEHLSEYRFGTGVARHFYCRHCGIKSFYVPRSHPDQISIHARCLQPGTVVAMQITAFDGADWERARSDLG